MKHQYSHLIYELIYDLINACNVTMIYDLINAIKYVCRSMYLINDLKCPYI